MSQFTLNFYSKALKSTALVNVILPVGMEYDDEIQPGEKFQTLWLLHGHGGNYSEWGEKTRIANLAVDHKFAVVMPWGQNSFYIDDPNGKQYFTFITEELPEFLRKHFPLSDKREDNFIAGNSMGGYGAAFCGLNCPDKYSAIGVFSSGPFDVPKMIESDSKSVLFTQAFGEDVDKIRNSKMDVWKMLKIQHEDPNVELPLLFNACGTEDFLFDYFNEFNAYAESIGVNVETKTRPGVHSWKIWDEFVTDFIDWLPTLKNRDYWLNWYKKSSQYK